MLLESVMMIWFVLTAMAVLYVAIDIRHTPENPVMKWGFILITLFFGPVGALLYIFGCRKHTPEEHARFIAARWRQVLGSTMHCVSGDGVGILTGAVIGALVSLPFLAEVALEYVLGFGFGWLIFQALFMKDMAGGSYRRSLESTFIPELLSMNCLMGGMLPVSALAFAGNEAAHDPTQPLFWFRMSLALMVGAAFAYHSPTWNSLETFFASNEGWGIFELHWPLIGKMDLGFVHDMENNDIMSTMSQPCQSRNDFLRSTLIIIGWQEI